MSPLFPEPRLRLETLPPVTFAVRTEVSHEAWETELYVGGRRAPRSELGYALAVFLACLGAKEEVKDEYRLTADAKALREVAEERARAQMLESFKRLGRTEGEPTFEHRWCESYEISNGVGWVSSVARLSHGYCVVKGGPP